MKPFREHAPAPVRSSEQRRPLALHRLSVAVFLLLSSLFPIFSLGGSESDRRVDIGIKLFRTMLAADLSIVEKADERGRLILVFFYVSNRDRAVRLGDRLEAGGTVRGVPITVMVTDDARLAKFRERRPAGIFLTELPRTQKTIDQLIEFGKRYGVIVYSPFEGHVEKGVTGGMYIASRVQPYVNMRTIRESRIRIKKFFMKVARTYE